MNTDFLQARIRVDLCPFVVLLVLTLLSFATTAAADESLVDLAEQESWPAVSQRLGAGIDANIKQADGMTALHWAAYHNHTATLEQLLAAGANVDAATAYQVTPLSLVCEYGCAECAKRLIAAKADVERRRLGKETPLMLAARNGNAEIVKALIDAGAKLDRKEQRGQTALMWAAAEGNLAAVDALIDAGADISIALKKSGLDAFMFAARQGKTDVVLRLLEAGVDVNSVVSPEKSNGRDPRKGMSATMFAIESGHLELALTLIEHGANPNDQRSGYAPLHAITWVRKTELGDNPAGDPAPRITGSTNSLDFVRRLVDSGAEVNLRLEEGKAKGQAKLTLKGATPFLLAAKTADVPLLNLLIELGADPSITNADGTTVIMAAAGVGVVAVGEEPGTPTEVELVIRMFAELGVDLNVTDKNGETAMHGAAYRNFPTIVAVLAELGADPKIWNQNNRHGWTPHKIAAGKRPGSVKPSPATIAALDRAVEATSHGQSDE